MYFFNFLTLLLFISVITFFFLSPPANSDNTFLIPEVKYSPPRGMSGVIVSTEYCSLFMSGIYTGKPWEDFAIIVSTSKQYRSTSIVLGKTIYCEFILFCLLFSSLNAASSLFTTSDNMLSLMILQEETLSE